MQHTDQTFAQRLRTLALTVHPPNRGPYTQKEIVAGIRELGGEISQQYLSELLRGVSRDPSERIVDYISRFFGVAPAYFADDEEYQRTNDYIDLVRRLGNSEVLAVSARAIDLPTDAINRIRQAVEEERQRAGFQD